MAVIDPLRHGLRAVRGIQAALANNGSPMLSPATPSVGAIPPLPPAKASAKSDLPTAFVSWAHSHSSWSSSQSRDWESQVATFAALMRRLGIPAEVDLFHLDEAIDWTRYGPHQVERSKYTLIVMSRAWAERWSGSNSPREGAGAAAEADTLKGLFARNQDEWQRRVAVVMFPEVSSEVVPPDLQRVARVSIDPMDPDSYEPLIRMVTGQPRYPRPPLGEIPVLEPATVYKESITLVTLRERLSDIEKRKKQIASRVTKGAQTERERLDLSEAATRGFIDAELTIED